MPDPKLLRGATVITSDAAVPDLLRGDVLIDDGKIAAIGAGLPAPGNAAVADLDGLIVLPGLVDAHQHVWEGPYLLSRPDDSIGTYFADFVPAAATMTADQLYQDSRAALDTALRSGTTTVFDWCHATNTIDHAEAAWSALDGSPLKGVFGYGPPIAYGYYGKDVGHPDTLEQFAANHRGTSGSTLLAACLRGPDLSPEARAVEDIHRARALELPVSMHIATRRAGPGGVTALLAADLLGPDVQLVHATDASDDELRALIDHDVRLVVPPIAELTMGTGLPPLDRLARFGGSAALGVDSVVAAPPDMFAQMREALLLWRRGEWAANGPPPSSTCREVIAAATIGGARACWLDSVTGSLTPGKQADLLVLRPSRPVTSLAEAYAQVVWMGNPEQIVAVLLDGEAAHTNEQLITTSGERNARGQS